MRNILPSLVLDHIRDRYVAGVADAEAYFNLHRADEDAVSGALGQSIAMREPVTFTTPNGTYQAKISYRKIRGRGPGAPERRYGADGLFQISVTDEAGSVLLRKGLPFQSKMNWRGKKADLYSQALRMQNQFKGGLVIDFTPNGYKACTAQAAIAAKGSRPMVDKFGAMRPLGQVLGGDFLECTIGTHGLFFEPDAEHFGVEADLFPGAHVISTDVVFIGESAA